MYCSLDSDGDQFPEVAVRTCSVSERQQNLSYCRADSCPTVFNLPQSNTAPCTNTTSEGTSDNDSLDNAGVAEPVRLLRPWRDQYFLLTWHCNEKAIDYCIVAWYLAQSVMLVHADGIWVGLLHMQSVSK